jgi:hypothetical protein
MASQYKKESRMDASPPRQGHSAIPAWPIQISLGLQGETWSLQCQGMTTLHACFDSHPPIVGLIVYASKVDLLCTTQ